MEGEEGGNAWSEGGIEGAPAAWQAETLPPPPTLFSRLPSPPSSPSHDHNLESLRVPAPDGSDATYDVIVRAPILLHSTPCSARPATTPPRPILRSPSHAPARLLSSPSALTPSFPCTCPQRR